MKTCILQVLIPRVGAKPALGHRHVVRGVEKQTAGTSGEDKKKSVPKPEGKLEKEQEKESKPQKVRAWVFGIASNVELARRLKDLHFLQSRQLIQMCSTCRLTASTGQGTSCSLHQSNP